MSMVSIPEVGSGSVAAPVLFTSQELKTRPFLTARGPLLLDHLRISVTRLGISLDNLPVQAKYALGIVTTGSWLLGKS